MADDPRFYDTCVYTILHTPKLDEIYKSGGSANLSEKKSWSTAYSLFGAAKDRNLQFPIIYGAAEKTKELIYYGVITDISIDKEEGTRYSIRDLTPFESPLPHKTNLILRSTGKAIHEGFIRPYAICKTPEVLLNKG